MHIPKQELKFIFITLIALALNTFSMSIPASAHTFDNKTLFPSGITVCTSNPCNFTFTTTSGATLLVLSMSNTGVSPVARTGGAPTFNSVTMTDSGQGSVNPGGTYEEQVELWYLLNPAIGAYTVSVPNSLGLDLKFIVSSYKSGTGASAFDKSNKSSNTDSANPDIWITATGSNIVIVDSVCDGEPFPPSANSHTLLYQTDLGSQFQAAQYALLSSSGIVNLNWTVTTGTDDWAMIVASFNETSTAQTYIPPTPINLANTTGNYWVNHTWEAGTGNITISYNMSVNATWTNGSATTFYNNTNVGVSGWSNITVWAYNSTNGGKLSLTNTSQNTQAPSAPDTSFTVTLPVGYSQGFFNASLTTESNVNASGQTLSAGFLNITNTGTAPENFLMNVTSASPSGATLKADTDNNPTGATTITTTLTQIITGLGTGLSQYIWLWVDYNNAAPMNVQRTMTINSS